jgi:hypothetical protein
MNGKKYAQAKVIVGREFLEQLLRILITDDAEIIGIMNHYPGGKPALHTDNFEIFYVTQNKKIVEIAGKTDGTRKESAVETDVNTEIFVDGAGDHSFRKEIFAIDDSGKKHLALKKEWKAS